MSLLERIVNLEEALDLIDNNRIQAINLYILDKCIALNNSWDSIILLMVYIVYNNNKDKFRLVMAEAGIIKAGVEITTGETIFNNENSIYKIVDSEYSIGISRENRKNIIIALAKFLWGDKEKGGKKSRKKAKASKNSTRKKKRKSEYSFIVIEIKADT